jgi:hypothetical protein
MFVRADSLKAANLLRLPCRSLFFPRLPIARRHAFARRSRWSLNAKENAVMKRPISKYLDYVICADPEAWLHAERQERDRTLLQAIRLQSFGPTQPAYLQAESMPTSAHARADIVFAHDVYPKPLRSEREPIPCSPTPNCRGHPCNPA